MPRSGVEAGARVFIRGVDKVNSNDLNDDFNIFIREYTKSQYEIRFGENAIAQGALGINEAIQKVSDGIAENILLDILDQLNDPDNSNPQNLLPTATRIATFDAQAAANVLFGTSQIAGWAGNPLFVTLGVDEPYNTNILADTSGYNALSVLKSMVDAASVLGIPATGIVIYDVLAHIIPDAGAANFALVADAAADTQLLLNNAYGTGVFETVTSTIQLGKADASAEIFTATVESDDVINAGGGNDTIIGLEGDGIGLTVSKDLIDGGAGTDVVDYSTLSNAKLIVTIKEASQPLTNHLVGSVDKQIDGFSNDGVDSLFNIERIIGSTGNDAFIIQDISDKPLTLSGGEGTDELSALFSESGVTIGANGTIIVTGSPANSVINFDGIEKLQGSKFNDIIAGGSGNDTILGDNGNDTLSGLGGNDQLEGGLGFDKYSFDSGHGTDIITDEGVDDRLILNGVTVKKADVKKNEEGEYELQGYTVTHNENENNLLLTKGDDSITLNDWEEGDYGISLLKEDKITFRYETTINASAVGGSSNAPLIMTYSFSSNAASGSGSVGANSPFYNSYGPIEGTLQIGDQITSLSA